MKILNSDSLVQTVERFNEAVLFKDSWESEAAHLVAWISGRLGQSRAYAGSFALTDSDWNRAFRLFTGEQVTTRVARAHIMAEEASRLLRIIQTQTRSPIQALSQSDQCLGTQIFQYVKSKTQQTGFYCCGKCSVAFWRYLAAGGFAEHEACLAAAMETLRQSRDGKGGWNRFPYYYTLSCLAELDEDIALDEIAYTASRIKRILPRLSKGQDIYSQRRREIIKRLEERLN